MQLPFIILCETTKTFPKFNATGRSLFIKFNTPGEEQETITYLRKWITSLNDYLVGEVAGLYLVCLKISNSINVQDKMIDISLKRCDQLKPDVFWDMLRKIIQNNASICLIYHLKVHLDHARMPAINGKGAESRKGTYWPYWVL
jgi:hypothetical protein